VKQQIREIEQTRLERLDKAPAEGPHAMVRLLARVIGIGMETADMLVREVLSRTMRDRRVVARYAGLTGSPDESGSKRREKGLARSGNARVRRGMVQLWVGAKKRDSKSNKETGMKWRMHEISCLTSRAPYKGEIGCAEPRGPLTFRISMVGAAPHCADFANAFSGAAASTFLSGFSPKPQSERLKPGWFRSAADGQGNCPDYLGRGQKSARPAGPESPLRMHSNQSRSVGAIASTDHLIEQSSQQKLADLFTKASSTTSGLGMRLLSEVATLQFVHERALLLAFRCQKLVIPCHPSTKSGRPRRHSGPLRAIFLARNNKTAFERVVRLNVTRQ
jgi:hypothetical protein